MNLRIATHDRALFDLAASALGTSRSEFMLAASRKMAEATLMDRRLFSATESVWDNFVAELDKPTPPNALGLEKLKSAAFPWSE